MEEKIKNILSQGEAREGSPGKRGVAMDNFALGTYRSYFYSVNPYRVFINVVVFHSNEKNNYTARNPVTPLR